MVLRVLVGRHRLAGRARGRRARGRARARQARRCRASSRCRSTPCSRCSAEAVVGWLAAVAAVAAVAVAAAVAAAAAAAAAAEQKSFGGFWTVAQAARARRRRADRRPPGAPDRSAPRSTSPSEELADERGRAVARDVAVIAGVVAHHARRSRRSRCCPSIPFAPGHKLVLLTPLYIVASLLTRTRFGATLTGLAMGTVAFLLGDGTLRHLRDPEARRARRHLRSASSRSSRAGGRTPGAVAWSLVGGAHRRRPLRDDPRRHARRRSRRAVAWAILVPGLVVHTTFGAALGLRQLSPLVEARRRSAPRATTS